MKKSIFYSLFVYAMAVIAVGFASCSDDDDPYFYTFQLASENLTGGSEDAMDLDISLVENAVTQEFNGKVVAIKGSKDACDKEAISRFNKACESVTLKGGWKGDFTYTLFITGDKGMTQQIANKKFTMSE